MVVDDQARPDGQAEIAEPLEIELQNLVAVQECTSRELLPEAYQNLDRSFVTQRIRELKGLLDER